MTVVKRWKTSLKGARYPKPDSGQSIWTILLKTCFNLGQFCEVVRQLDRMIVVGSN